MLCKDGGLNGKTWYIYTTGWKQFNLNQGSLAQCDICREMVQPCLIILNYEGGKTVLDTKSVSCFCASLLQKRSSYYKENKIK